MKPRRVEELIDFMDNSTQRRKRELVTLRSTLTGGREHEVPLACRSAIVFCYAHWEGFVKDAAQAYVSYVNHIGPPVSGLIPGFQALACKTRVLLAAAATKRIAPHIDVVALFTQEFGQRVSIDAVKAIDTESNLTWEVFQNICLSIGVDVAVRWATYSKFMNELFANRCAIAHGGLDLFAVAYANEAILQVVDFLEWFKADVENAALNELFRQPAPVKTPPGS